MPETAEATRQTCLDGTLAHEWVVETPHGPTSHGVCERCGLEDDFLNWIPQVVNGFDFDKVRMSDIWLPGSKRL